MAPKYPKLLQIGQQIGDILVERVLEGIFVREFWRVFLFARSMLTDAM